MSNSSEEMLEQFDKYLESDDVAALVIRESLIPVEGKDGVVFPATYAAGTNFKGGYNIDSPKGKEEQNVCLIDSVGSQANRMEPLFKKPPYDELVPQIIFRAGGDKEINLLDVGHRAGDAIVRCTELQDTLEKAFKAVLSFNHEPLGEIAPTSLVFGVWDSRNTQAKLPRLIASTIRAFNVRKLTRSAQYSPPLDYSKQEVFTEEEKQKAEGDSKNPLAQQGFVAHPATGSHGGVIADEGIRRDAVLSLAALRLLKTKEDGDAKKKRLTLRRYIFGLALTAFTAPTENYLRQGCMLVNDPENPAKIEEVHRNGQRTSINFDHEDALAFAQKAMQEFWKDKTESGVPPNQTFQFDPDKARKDVQEAKKKAKKSNKKN